METDAGTAGRTTERFDHIEMAQKPGRSHLLEFQDNPLAFPFGPATYGGLKEAFFDFSPRHDADGLTVTDATGCAASATGLGSSSLPGSFVFTSELRFGHAALDMVPGQGL